MKIEVNREAIAGILNELLPFKQTFMEAGGVTATIAPVMIEIDGSVMTMKAVGDGFAIMRSLELKVLEPEEDFMVVVDAIGMQQLLKKKSLGKTVTLDFPRPEPVCIIASKSYEYALKLCDASWFTGIAFPDRSPDDVSILAADLNRLISSVSFAMGKKGRPEIAGVYLHTDFDSLVAVATNGARLARYAVKKPGVLDWDEGFTVPAKNIDAIIKFLNEAGDLFGVTMRNESGKLALWSDHGMIVTNLVDAKYPDYKRLVSLDPMPMELDYMEFAVAIDLCLPTADKFVVVRTIEGEDGIAVESWNDRREASRNFIEHAEGTPPANPVAFNASYMTDCLQREVCVDFGDGNNPIRIRGKLDAEFYAMIVPMRVSIVEHDFGS